MLEMLESLTGEGDEVPSLPLPEVVDTPAVVLAGMLAGGRRPLVLDASAVREVQPTAAPLLVALLRAKRDAGATAHIAHVAAALRRRWAGHALAAWFAADEAAGGESLFTCPDRDELGFSPSYR